MGLVYCLVCLFTLNFHWYSLHLHTWGWPGRVNLGVWLATDCCHFEKKNTHANSHVACVLDMYIHTDTNQVIDHLL